MWPVKDFQYYLFNSRLIQPIISNSIMHYLQHIASQPNLATISLKDLQMLLNAFFILAKRCVLILFLNRVGYPIVLKISFI